MCTLGVEDFYCKVNYGRFDVVSGDMDFAFDAWEREEEAVEEMNESVGMRVTHDSRDDVIG